MTSRRKIVLASASAVRARLLRDAGVAFEQILPGIDETELKRACARDGLGLEETAVVLAEAKALSAKADAHALVIGADQILEFDNRGYDKPASMAEARERLRQLQGRAHTLINAIALARDGTIVWRNVDRARLVMRALKEDDIEAYLSVTGEAALASVGAYQLEGLGARLFECVEGDYFAVLGLSLLPLLERLRRDGALVF
jgi:septum formation protein